jgi:hypothetical protein
MHKIKYHVTFFSGKIHTEAGSNSRENQGTQNQSGTCVHAWLQQPKGAGWICPRIAQDATVKTKICGRIILKKKFRYEMSEDVNPIELRQNRIQACIL